MSVDLFGGTGGFGFPSFLGGGSFFSSFTGGGQSLGSVEAGAGAATVVGGVTGSSGRGRSWGVAKGSPRKGDSPVPWPQMLEIRGWASNSGILISFQNFPSPYYTMNRTFAPKMYKLSVKLSLSSHSSH